MTRFSPRRTATAGILAACTAAALAGCGSSEPATSANGAATTGATATTDSRPARSADELLENVAAAIKAESTVHVTRKSAQQNAVGDMRITDVGLDVEMKLTSAALGTQPVEMRLVDDTVYFSMPQTGAGKFFKVDPENALLKQLIDLMKNIRPSTELSSVAPAVTAFKDLGPSDIDGEKTEHYRLRVDTKKALAHSSVKIPLPESVTSKLPKTYNYDMYVADGYLLRRAVFDLLGQHNELNYTNWGKNVSIKAPEASEMIPAPSGF